MQRADVRFFEFGAGGKALAWHPLRYLSEIAFSITLWMTKARLGPAMLGIPIA